MSVRARVLALSVILLVTLSMSGIVLAQSDGPDPDSPVQERTPTPDDVETSPPEIASPEPPERTGTTIAASPVDDEGTPSSEATPVAAPGDFPLAALTLDSTTIPENYFLVAEYYTSPQELADNLAGQVESEQLFATGLNGMYQSYYVNEDGNTVRSYVISYDTVEGEQAGFDLLENEELLVPNGAFEDSPVPEGIGEEPGEISSGTIENGDGTQTNSYDISYRIASLEVGVAMETFDGSDPDADLVDQLAVDLSERVEAVLGGESVSGVDFDLPDQVLTLDGDITFEGFQTVSEAFLSDPDQSPDGYEAGYFIGVTYSRNVSSILPYVITGVMAFDSDDDAAALIDDAGSFTAGSVEPDEIRGVDIDGADDVVAFSYAAPGGEGDPDSVRIFAQTDDQVITVDVQGMDSVDAAESAATELAQAELDCALEGDCADPGVMESAT